MGRDLRRARKRREAKRAARRQASEQGLARGRHQAVLDRAHSRRQQEDMIRRKEAGQ